MRLDRELSARRGRLGTVSLRVVLALDDVLHALVVGLASLLRRRDVTVLPFIGYGTTRQVRARGRVVLGRAAEGATDLVRAAANTDVPPRPVARRQVAVARFRKRWSVFQDAMAPFLTIDLPRCPVRVRGPHGEVAARCDRQGYLDVPVDIRERPPGWHELTVTASWRGTSAEVPVPVLVVDPASRVAVVSDLDDTVIETGITRGLEFLRLTLLTNVTERTPLPGAAELYRALTAARGGPDRPVFYLSTSPWNLYELLTRFLVLRGFPAGPLLLTEWGPSRTNLFRVTVEQHKLTLIRSLLAEHPGLRVVLIGDTGQLDPEIYAAVAQEAPDRVLAVYVRRTAGMRAARAVEVSGLARRVAAAGVPMLMVEDSLQIAEHAAGLGLLDQSDVGGVRRASQQ